VGHATKTDLAREVWEEILGYFFAHKEVHSAVLQELGLTPGHMKTLFVLDPDEPRSMGELAEAMACDASNATWLVDRLEERQLVERRPHPRDRRVKTVVLTDDGVKLKASLVDAMAEPPADLVALDRADLERLSAAVRLLPPHPAFFEAAQPAPAEAHDTR
jgi:DNA-binding MarR family transcriptional regulator